MTPASPSDALPSRTAERPLRARGQPRPDPDGPAVIILAVFIAYPFLLGIWYSLINARIGVPGTFVGLDNFIANAQNGIFQQTLRNTFVYTGITTCSSWCWAWPWPC